MRPVRARTAVWEFLAVVAVAGTVLSLASFERADSLAVCGNGMPCNPFMNNTFTCTDGREVPSALNCSDLCMNATNGSQCATVDQNLCLHAVCQSGNCSVIEEFVPPICDDGDPCTNDTCDICAENCSGACMSTPINDSPECALGLGEPCELAEQCASGFCADGVCCNAACDGATQACNLPGQAGQCVGIAAAPAMSWQGMLLIGVLLAAIGMFGLRALRGAH